MVTAVLGNKASFKRGNGDGPPETFTKIAGVTGVQGMGVKSTKIDTTDFDTTGNEMTNMPGMKDRQDMSVDLIFDYGDSTQNGIAGVIADAENQTVKNWELDFGNTGANKVSGPGYLSDYQHTAPLNGKQTLKITVTPTGPWTYA